MSLEKVKDMNIAEIIQHHGTTDGIKDRTFLIYRNNQAKIVNISYEELYEKSLLYGNMINQVKIEQGKEGSNRFHVGVFMQNIPEFFYLFGGCAFTNSTLVGINNAQIGEKLAFDINNIDVSLLLVDDVKQPGTEGTFFDTVLNTKKNSGFQKLTEDYIVVVTQSDNSEKEKISTVTKKLQQHANTLKNFTPCTLDISNAGVIIFTSGTTGAPKGIEVTWEKLYDVGVICTDILSYTQDDVGYVCMPLNHSNSLYLNVMPAMLNGAKILIRRRFSVSNFVKDIEDSGTTIWNCVGDPVQYLLNNINHKIGDNADFSNLSIRTVISTGTNAANRAAFTKIFGLDIFTEIYGSTEAGAITAVDDKSPDYSVGKILKDIRIFKEDSTEECELANVDKDGKILNLDRCAGEVVVSHSSLGASAFTGYYKLPQESSKKICTYNDEEFYRMGDLGALVEIDKIKYLIFLGRTGDWIRFKGENWAPVDGEKIINKYEGITNAGIIGVPQSVGKEDDPMFIIELEDAEGFDMDDFYSYCKKELPHYMLPKYIRIVEELPMTDTMKLKKTILKKEFYFRDSESDAVTDDMVYEIVEGRSKEFTEDECKIEIKKFTDPTNQDRLRAFTKREDLF